MGGWDSLPHAKEPEVLTVFSKHAASSGGDSAYSLTLRFIAGGASRHHTPLPNVVTGGPFSYSDSERHTPNRKGSQGGRSVRGREPLFQTGKHAGPGTEHIATARRARRRSSPAHLRRQIGGSALGADGVIVPRLEELASGNPTWVLQPGGSLSRRQHFGRSRRICYEENPVAHPLSVFRDSVSPPSLTC